MGNNNDNKDEFHLELLLHFNYNINKRAAFLASASAPLPITEHPLTHPPTGTLNKLRPKERRRTVATRCRSVVGGPRELQGVPELRNTCQAINRTVSGTQMNFCREIREEPLGKFLFLLPLPSPATSLPIHCR